MGASLRSVQDDGAELLSRREQKRESMRLGLPSKGRMAEDTQELLKDCQLSVYKPNPRQYVATISQLPDLEVWFQRASDVVRKLVRGDLDLGIVGADMFEELAADSPDLIVLHGALDFGHCHLGLGVPTSGRWAEIHTLEDLRDMPEWTAETPLRIVTGYQAIARRFFEEKGFQHFVLLAADGALEAHPAMGSADIILDLVSTGVTLRENNLKELDGARIMDSQGVLVGNRAALLARPELLAIVHELIERFEAHLTAGNYYSVIANMRGESAEEVAGKILASERLRGLQGPTISPVFTPSGSNGAATAEPNLFGTTICVPKKQLYASVNELRKLGGSGVLVQPMTYIFDEEPARWRQLLDKLGLDEPPARV